MNSPIKKIAIIGTGVIGAGWTIRLLAKNKVVNVYDPNISQLNFLKNEIRRVSKSVLRFYKTNKLNINNLYFNNSIKDAVKDADLIHQFFIIRSHLDRIILGQAVVESLNKSTPENNPMPIHKLETHQADIHYFMLSREVVQAIDNPDALPDDVETLSGNASVNSDIFIRLGYVTLGTDYGDFTIGKNWSVYYDIGAWTDRFDVFGATAQGTYEGGDGGGIGRFRKSTRSKRTPKSRFSYSASVFCSFVRRI